MEGTNKLFTGDPIMISTDYFGLERPHMRWAR